MTKGPAGIRQGPSRSAQESQERAAMFRASHAARSSREA